MQEAFIRHFDLAGASNFRDLGGYPAQDGRPVRWRQIFRSNHLGHLTEADIAVLRGLGVRSAFDFRGREERDAARCAVEGIVVHSLPVEPSVVAMLRTRRDAGAALSPDDAFDVMRESYRNYVRQSTASYRDLFAHLLEDRAPLVIHCTAGKDRTGFACALILHALGVAENVIAEDYLLTNRFYRRDPSASSDLPDNVRQVLATVEASFLAAAFEVIRADYGDLEGYLRDGLGLGPPSADGARGPLSGALTLARTQPARSRQAAASSSASRSAMTSSNAEMACCTVAICISSQPLIGPIRFCRATIRSRRCSLSWTSGRPWSGSGLIMVFSAPGSARPQINQPVLPSAYKTRPNFNQKPGMAEPGCSNLDLQMNFA